MISSTLLDAVTATAFFSIFVFLISVVRPLKLAVRRIACGLTLLFFGLVFSMINRPRMNVQVFVAASAVLVAGILYSARRKVLELARSTDRLHSMALQEKVTELRTSEEMLGRSQAFLDSVLENVPLMIFVKDAQHLKFVSINRASEPLTGFPRNEFIGKSDYDLFPKEMAEHFVKTDRQVLQGRKIVDIPEENIQSPNGPRILHTRKIPILDASGNPEYLLGISEDITDWKLSQEAKLKLFKNQIALDERERSARQTQFLSDATITLASSFDYRDALKTLSKMFVKHLGDWCTITLMDESRNIVETLASHRDPMKQVLLEEFVQQVPQDENDPNGVAQVIRTGQTVHRPLIETSDLGPRAHSKNHLDLIIKLGAISAVIVPIKIREVVHGAIAIVSSHTERFYDKQDVAIVEEVGRRAGIAIENAKLYEAVQKAVRARDEFMSIASHELKTPLTALKLQLELARRNTKPELNIAPAPEKIAKMLDASSQQVNRLTVLVDDLLDVSRIEAGRLNFNFEKIDLLTVVLDVTERFRDQIQNAGSSIKMDYQSRPYFVKADRFRIEQVFLNVLSNAIKYGAGGKIEVSVSENEGQVVVSFRDYGMGVPEGKTEKIFERFERAVESSHISGLGLGLYIAHEIITAHDGTIVAQSKLGEGSTFTIKLPAHVEENVAKSAS